MNTLVDYLKQMLESGNVPLPGTEHNKLDKWHNADVLKMVAKKHAPKKTVVT
jgi:hypothetical protein